MFNLWKEYRGLAATRTGVPALPDWEEDSFSESRRGSWIAVLAVALAFALALQMDSENHRSSNVPHVVAQSL
jgi:hypothetical protein